jgi:hypothetical protein
MKVSMIGRIVLWTIVSLGVLGLVWATIMFRGPAVDEEVLKHFSWSDLKKAGQLNVGEIQPPGPGAQHESLKIENRANEPKTVTLLELKGPGVTALRFGFEGSVRHEDVRGRSYLEMWSYFADGGPSFSRTLGDAGVMRHLEGTSDWRPFVLPCFSDETIGLPRRLVVNVVFVGSGTVYLSPLRLFQLCDGWWTDQQAGLIGGFGGSICGLLGSLIGILVHLGKARRFVVATTATLTVVGVITILVGLIAVSAGQPFAVSYLLLLGGIMFAAVCGATLPLIRRRYEQLELRKMAAMDAQ